MKPTAKVLSYPTLAISLCSLLVFFQQPDARSQSNQRGSTAEVAEESQLSASLVELYKAGKFDQALPVGKRLLELREKMFGAEDPLVAIALSDLAEIYRAKEKYDDAQPLYRRGLGILEHNPGANPQLLSNVLERLADHAFAKRDYKGSSAFLARALAVKETALGKDDPSLIALLHHLANTFQAQRQFDQAEPLYLRSLTIAEQRIGKRDPETISMMKDYACLDLRERHPIGPQEEKREDPNRNLKQRASCWLYGFRDDCDVYAPEGGQKPDQIGSARADVFVDKPGQVLNGRAVMLPKPIYPQRARLEHVFGTVFVALRIDEGGNVIEAKTVCGGPPLLLDPALKAARGAKFTPTIIDGKPKQVYGVVTYNFVRL